MSGFRPSQTGRAGLLTSVARGRPEGSGIRSTLRDRPVADMNLLRIDGHLQWALRARRRQWKDVNVGRLWTNISGKVATIGEVPPVRLARQK